MDGPRPDEPATDPDWQRLLSRLFARAKRGMVLGLDRVEQTLARLGHPERRFRSVQIAGTNGKGSTAAFMAYILSGGRKVGLYTSPHLVSLTERIQFVRDHRCEEVTREEFYAAMAEVEAHEMPGTQLTFFELITVAALLIFARREVDIAILEAGLGARLDATSAVDAEVGVLTDLAIDHADILGGTLEKIAYEKSFVMRKGRPLVTAGAPEGAMAVISGRADELGVPIHRLGARFYAEPDRTGPGRLRFELEGRSLLGVRLGLFGAHQRRNALLATRAALIVDPSLDDRSLRAGLAKTRWSGRLEPFLTARVLLDGAHNPQGAGSLKQALLAPEGPWTPPYHLIFGALADKDVGPMLDDLSAVSAKVIVTCPNNPRALPAQAIAAVRPSLGLLVCPDPREALAKALALREEAGGWVVVAGSLFLLGDLRPLVVGLTENP